MADTVFQIMNMMVISLKTSTVTLFATEFSLIHES